MESLASRCNMRLYRTSVKEDINICNVFQHLAENYVNQVKSTLYPSYSNNFLPLRLPPPPSQFGDGSEMSETVATMSLIQIGGGGGGRYQVILTNAFCADLYFQFVPDTNQHAHVSLAPKFGVFFFKVYGV